MKTKTYALYFVDSDGQRTKIKDGLRSMATILDLVSEDMAQRLPGFQSFYTRVNGVLGEDDELWIDFGSHSRFYTLVKEG